MHGSNSKDYNILGSILGSAYLGQLPKESERKAVGCLQEIGVPLLSIAEETQELGPCLTGD